MFFFHLLYKWDFYFVLKLLCFCKPQAKKKRKKKHRRWKVNLRTLFVINRIVPHLPLIGQLNHLLIAVIGYAVGEQILLSLSKQLVIKVVCRIWMNIRKMKYIWEINSVLYITLSVVFKFEKGNSFIIVNISVILS